jgi:hypothetical protein
LTLSGQTYHQMTLALVSLAQPLLLPHVPRVRQTLLQFLMRQRHQRSSHVPEAVITDNLARPNASARHAPHHAVRGVVT